MNKAGVRRLASFFLYLWREKKRRILFVSVFSLLVVACQYISLGFVFAFLKLLSGGLYEVISAYGVDLAYDTVVYGCISLFFAFYIFSSFFEYCLRCRISSYIEIIRREVEEKKDGKERETRLKLNQYMGLKVKVERAFYMIISPIWVVLIGLGYLMNFYPLVFAFILAFIVVSMSVSALLARGIDFSVPSKKERSVQVEKKSYKSRLWSRIVGGVFFSLFLILVSVVEEDVANILIVIVIGRLLLSNISQMNYLVREIFSNLSSVQMINKEVS